MNYQLSIPFYIIEKLRKNGVKAKIKLTTLFAPLLSAYFTESKAATILWFDVIFPSLIGTLKSTL